jgi:hypothetical protein
MNSARYVPPGHATGCVLNKHHPWKELSGVNAHRSQPIPNRRFGGLPAGAVGGFWASPSADLAQASSGHALKPSTLEMAGQTVVSISFHPRC